MKKTPILVFLILLQSFSSFAQTKADSFRDPAREFSVMPFWFWNDTLTDREIIRQITDFESKGVYGFVIHPRMGLPHNIKWLSPEMIHFMRTAVEEAARRGMYVILYDEGMYPSGSSSGQVVEKNPAHAARGLAKVDLKPGEEYNPPEGTTLIAINTRKDGSRVAVTEKFTGGNIRGLHFIGEGTGSRIREVTPPAGDILNPEAVSSFIDLVYNRFAKEFGKYFGNTIIGIFTDEPDPLGRGSARGMIHGNAKLIPRINEIAGYDITPFLSDLWYNDTPESMKHRHDYHHGVNICFEEIYYKALSDWCASHGIALMGHPAKSMDIGTEKYFQIPGQDLVWRYVEPGLKALNGEHSTMAKCASSAMVHLGYRRNSNELYGAYGHNLTWEEVEWLANWCFVRGHNLLIPHAFYYSIRGPRLDERPPDVGPNKPWWNDYKPYADACRRLSWINTDSKHVCEVAVLAEPTFLPWKAAKDLYQNQIDFNYLEYRHLTNDAENGKKGVRISGMTYKAVILDSLTFIPGELLPELQKLADNGRLILCSKRYHEVLKNAIVAENPDQLKAALMKIVKRDIILSPPSASIRYRHLIKNGEHFYMFFNEEKGEVKTKIATSVKRGRMQWLNQSTGEPAGSYSGDEVTFAPYEMKILGISGKKK